MKTKSNVHTHSTYCDGKDTLREMIEKAISLNFRSIGFSSHSYTGLSFDESQIKDENIDKYIAELEALKEEYKDRIRIYKGFEYDSRNSFRHNPIIDPRLDYSIGSVHFFHDKGKYFFVDWSLERQDEALEYFGSFRKMALNYFEEVIRFAYTSSYDIVGHFDLITKFIEKGGYNPEKDAWYIKMSLEALDAVADTDKLFEINTGAIARGYRTSQYPSRFLLERLKERKTKLILTSDCHNRDYLDCYFNEAEALLRSIGINELYELTDDGFKPYSLI